MRRWNALLCTFVLVLGACCGLDDAQAQSFPNRPITLVIPKEGAVLGIDTVAIMKGSKKAELAYKFINTLYDPEIQAEIAKLKKGSPAVLNAKVDPEIAKLPGVFTTAAQWKQQINIDPKLRAEKTAEWRKWFAENIMN